MNELPSSNETSFNDHYNVELTVSSHEMGVKNINNFNVVPS